MPIDAELFHSHMRDRGLVEIFLRGHLWVEKFLADLIASDLKNPAAIQLDRMPFSQKVSLALAIGLLSEGEALPLRIMNKVRNRLAHDLAGDPTSEDLRSLEGSLSGLHRETFEKLLDWEPGDLTEGKRLEHLIHGIIASLEMHRMRHTYWRDNQQAINTYSLIRELYRQTGGEYDDEALRRQYGVPPPPDPKDIWVRKRE